MCQGSAPQNSIRMAMISSTSSQISDSRFGHIRHRLIPIRCAGAPDLDEVKVPRADIDMENVTEGVYLWGVLVNDHYQSQRENEGEGRVTLLQFLRRARTSSSGHFPGSNS